ncbi:Phosphoglucose isomerase (PGI) [Pyrenophora seminiperda CCB06]|uniref:Phosphoglucose isomerase (PGI) n=1 Tax=Pyrenophora seminiperda CCB06 TaxID=1302712 RepID=A0A3M7MG29_9PLEO|nr:Phosphoglucose isomerase (PGI) [Pyrenophora seminiperda CCB06]
MSNIDSNTLSRPFSLLPSHSIMARETLAPSWLPTVALFAFWSSLATALSGQEPMKSLEEARGYNPGEPIPIVDASGHLQYIPFPVCAETQAPLHLSFGREGEINCTIPFITDEFFHLLEFYIHNDAPLSCRIPSKPLPPSVYETTYRVSDESTQEGVLGSQSNMYTPLVIALAGTLQLSHLHVGNYLNLLVHASPKSVSKGTVDAATAYSVSSRTRNSKITIGDSLNLQFSVRWYPSTTLPPGWTGYGGHIYTSTLVYCFLSAVASAAVCVVYFRGVELPRRLRRYATDRMGGGGRGFGNGGGGSGYGLPVTNGRGGVGMGGGYGLGGYGYSGGGGKRAD